MKRMMKKFIVLLTLIGIMSGNLLHASAASDPYLTGYKWNKTNLTYYVDTTPSPGVPSIFSIIVLEPAIHDTFSTWNIYLSAYEINLSFQETTNRSEADIIVKYGPTGVGTWGRVVPEEVSGTTYVEVSLTINDYSLQGVDGGTIYDVIMHEIGHTIGLADIKRQDAEAIGLYSLMINDMDSPNFRSAPTYEFDRVNIRKMY